MKLHQLQYFREVCVQNGITKAAEALHISQPAVSNAIKELEEEFHLQLFKRVNKKLILTKEGAYFLLEVEELLNKSNALTEKMCHLGEKKSAVRLGLPPMIGVMSLGLIDAFHKAYPEIEIDLYDGTSLTLRRMLQEDKVDVIIVSGRNSDGNNMGCCVLQQSELVLSVGKNHHLKDEKSVSIAHAALEPLAMVKDSFYVREKVLDRFRENNCTPRTVCNAEQLYSKIQMIRNEMAAGFLFREIAENEEKIVGISLDPPLMVDIEMAWLKNGTAYHNLNTFMQFAKKYAAEHGLRCVK